MAMTAEERAIKLAKQLHQRGLDLPRKILCATAAIRAAEQEAEARMQKRCVDAITLRALNSPSGPRASEAKECADILRSIGDEPVTLTSGETV